MNRLTCFVIKFDNELRNLRTMFSSRYYQFNIFASKGRTSSVNHGFATQSQQNEHVRFDIVLQRVESVR